MVFGVVFALLSRWIHIIGSTFVVGSFYAYTHFAYSKQRNILPTDFFSEMHIILAAVTVSGLYNMWVLRPKAKALPPFWSKVYHIILHSKILLGIGAFYITIRAKKSQTDVTWQVTTAYLVFVIVTGSICRNIREAHSAPKPLSTPTVQKTQ